MSKTFLEDYRDANPKDWMNEVVDDPKEALVSATLDYLSNLTKSYQDANLTDLAEKTHALHMDIHKHDTCETSGESWSEAMSRGETRLMLQATNTTGPTFTSLGDDHLAVMGTLKSISAFDNARGKTAQEQAVNYLADITDAAPYKQKWDDMPDPHRIKFLGSCGKGLLEGRLEGSISPLEHQISSVCLAHLWADHDGLSTAPE